MINFLISRPIELCFVNKTHIPLEFKRLNTFTGTKAEATLPTIAFNQTSKVYAEQDMLNGGGPSGRFSWEGIDSNVRITFTYDHPIESEPTNVSHEIEPPDYQVLETYNDLQQHSAKASYEIVKLAGDTTIHLRNSTNQDLYILIFQWSKKIDLSDSNKTLFPVVWKVYPLSKSQMTTIIYPISLQIGVKDDISTIQDSQIGIMWEYILKGDFTKLLSTEEKPINGVLGCYNRIPKVIDIGLAKNSKEQKINNLCVVTVLRNSLVIPFRKIFIKNDG
jgi:hypothetical protein